MCVLQRSSAALRSGSSSEWLYTPAIPPREPDTWLTHNSMTSGLTPSSAIPVTAVRRKSCSRHGAIAALRGGWRAAVSIAASSLRLARDQPLGGVVPVVVKTRSCWPGGTSASAVGGNSTLYGRLFLVLLPGNCHNPLACNSVRRIPATSLRRAPVKSSSLKMAPNGSPIASQACPKNRISSLLKVRSRGLGAAGRCSPAHGLLLTRRCRCSHVNNALSAA